MVKFDLLSVECRLTDVIPEIRRNNSGHLAWSECGDRACERVRIILSRLRQRTRSTAAPVVIEDDSDPALRIATQHQQVLPSWYPHPAPETSFARLAPASGGRGVLSG
jgi:hypothetical protein